ncbi:MAG TPA: M4 family metallopeptidase, partial [Polyangia bacterium]|nr:M4 family metallopeptidase [Polyangia bacterium]
RSARMIRLTLVSALAVAFAGCGRPSLLSATHGDQGALDALAQLDAETGVTWTARWYADIHTPALLEGRTAPLANTAVDAARAGRVFIRAHAALFSLADADDVESTDGSTDELGMTHARFAEKAQDYDVWGGQLYLHFASDGALVRINGRFIPVTSDLGTPELTSQEALVAAVAAARAASPWSADAFTTYVPKLYAYPVDAQTVKLAWRVQIAANDDSGTALLESFVDAADGSILHAADITEYLAGSGVGVFGDRQSLVVAADGASYILEDDTRGAPPTRTYGNGGTTKLPGIAVRSKDPQAWDTSGDGKGAAVDAHAFVAASWDYFADVHGQRGWDGSGKGVHTTVHYGNAYDNAFFDGTQLVFGDGDGALFAPLSGALDIVAHEFTHGVTAHTAALGAEGETGALNEAIADVFACFIEGNWQIGETVFHPSGQPVAIRDIANPHASGNPAALAEWVTATEDNGGVHVNSTIASHAAYLMTVGDNALPSATVEKIWYRALARYLYSDADFAAAADATIAAAKDLGSGAETTVRAAWVAAGVIPAS